MKWKKHDQYHVIRVEKDEEIITALKDAARSAGIEGAFFFGLGVGKNLELGYFDAHGKTYVRKTFDGEYEFTNIVGNVSVVDGELIIHCHVTITDAEFNAFGGHLFSGTVPATLELIVFPLTQPLVRSHDQSTGLNLLKL
jgi:predicted DNA-binding protein with PD1-like motif